MENIRIHRYTLHVPRKFCRSRADRWEDSHLRPNKQHDEINESNDAKKVRRDFVLFILVTSCALITFFVLKFYEPNANNVTNTVVVRIAGDLAYEFSQPGEWRITDSQNEYVTTLHYDGNSIWVTDSNCPDKICEKMGKVGQGGSIICVPNKMIIEFKKKETKGTASTTDVQTW
ncbi:MAG TPA: NusG domain II-containing protein [Fervidobacterium sp.]|nr:NusG domain II-containing protein [Fervidobacterium sp.]